MCDKTHHLGSAHGAGHVHVCGNPYNLSGVRSSVRAEMFGERASVADSAEVTTARLKLHGGESSESLIELASKLCLQFRYREAVSCLERALILQPDDFKAKRMLAIRYLTTARIDEALSAFLSLLEESRDKLDIQYRIALCHFYKGEYAAAKDCFVRALPLCEGNPDMYIAVLYWYIICLVRLKENVNSGVKLYREANYSHHAGYDYAVRLFMGQTPEEFDEPSKRDNLTRIMYAFGLYHYYIHKGNAAAAETVYAEALLCDEYWPSFSGLGFWYLQLNRKNANKT